MRLKIIGKPHEKGNFLVGRSPDIKVINTDTGEDITEDIRSIQINMAVNDIVTAKLEFCVKELDLEGIKADED